MSLSPLLSRLWPGATPESTADRPRRNEPRLPSPTAPAAPARREPMLFLPPPAESGDAPRHDLRSVSPRRFAEITHELYMEGALTWDEFQMVGFPSELHPRYNETIGALTGEKATPDRPRDMLADWERRVEFERRHEPDGDAAKRAARVLEVLAYQTRPPLDLSA